MHGNAISMEWNVCITQDEPSQPVKIEAGRRAPLSHPVLPTVPGLTGALIDSGALWCPRLPHDCTGAPVAAPNPVPTRDVWSRFLRLSRVEPTGGQWLMNVNLCRPISSFTSSPLVINLFSPLIGYKSRPLFLQGKHHRER